MYLRLYTLLGASKYVDDPFEDIVILHGNRIGLEQAMVQAQPGLPLRFLDQVASDSLSKALGMEFVNFCGTYLVARNHDTACGCNFGDTRAQTSK